MTSRENDTRSASAARALAHTGTRGSVVLPERNVLASMERGMSDASDLLRSIFVGDPASPVICQSEK